MSQASEYAQQLRSLARYSQCPENRSAFLRAAGLIEQLERENDALRSEKHALLASAAGSELSAA
ncbi:hypothetical protein [Noviherbaspirillum malthae]|uniref:hypothetical protein n=1 Tax=Noviherbaspirillum malthae TaxID=1260987 RepID=UPI0018903520|nr:hypothetical protein [Noviherbaspirillum malthae]